MKAFVTGGTGFIGANLVRLLLNQGYQVRCLVRPQSNLHNLKDLNIELVTGDLIETNLYDKISGCDVLFHVAAHYSLLRKEQELLYKYNVQGTKNILQAAKKAQIQRTVYTSSVAAIGVKENAIADENYQSPVENLIGDYKKSKYYAEQEAKKAIENGQDIVIVNPSTPIGAYDIKPTPTGEIIVRFLNRKMPFYMDTGLNLIHVQDVAMGHLLALEKGQTGERYILGNQNLTLKEILDKLAEITGLSAPKSAIPYQIPLMVAYIEEKILYPLGKKVTVPIDGVKMAQQKMYYTAEKAIAQLGLPQTSIDLALKDAVNWFKITVR
jgi:dihydroflavonol-4-reductase